MPSNLLKKYNEFLELLYNTERENLASFRKVFNRDIPENMAFKFRKRPVKPTTAEGEDALDRLFRHLTTKITDQATRKREFESERSIRLHWIRHHIEEQKKLNCIVFRVTGENRVYILDKDEKYVIVLEPLRQADAFYLLTAYHLGKSEFRSLMNKFENRGEELS